MRLESDKEMSAGWIAVPLLSVVAFVGYLFIYFLIIIPTIVGLGGITGPTDPTVRATIQFFFFLVGIFVLVLVASLIVFTIMLYKLVKRRNTHFARQAFLHDDLIQMAREVAAKRGVDVSLALNNLDRNVKEARFEETEKSAALWAILGLVTGLATYYIFYFLMKDFYKHERREDIFNDDLNRLLVTAGVPANPPRRTYPTPDRSFILYFILSLITAGLFTIYWVYVLLTDPNNHFRQQAMMEDTVMMQVSPALA